MISSPSCSLSCFCAGNGLPELEGAAARSRRQRPPAHRVLAQAGRGEARFPTPWSCPCPLLCVAGSAASCSPPSLQPGRCIPPASPGFALSLNTSFFLQLYFIHFPLVSKLSFHKLKYFWLLKKSTKPRLNHSYFSFESFWTDFILPLVIPPSSEIKIYWCYLHTRILGINGTSPILLLFPMWKSMGYNTV